MGWDYEVASESFSRCIDSKKFFESFYESFLAKSPEIPPLFADTDFVKQREVLAKSIPYMLTLASEKPVARSILETTAEIHSRRQLNIDPKFYPLWLDTLCETVKSYDPKWTPEIEGHWRRAMQPGIELFISKY